MTKTEKPNTRQLNPVTEVLVVALIPALVGFAAWYLLDQAGIGVEEISQAVVYGFNAVGQGVEKLRDVGVGFANFIRNNTKIKEGTDFVSLALTNGMQNLPNILTGK